jgi:hypothetical protein
MKASRRNLFMAVLLSLVSTGAVVAFYRTGQQYNDFHQVYGFGVNCIPLEELVFFIWYGLFGTIAAGALTAALRKTRWTDRLGVQLTRLIERPTFPALMLLLLFTEIICFRLLVLRDTPIADDEETYRFIAKTLLQGRLANPAPPDAEFYANQFIVISGGLWYGKYPLGHPLLLALGEALGLRLLVVPLITCWVAFVTYRLGQRLFSQRIAGIALLLLVVSPHFVFMGATDLSQPASTLFLMLGLYAALFIDKERAVLPGVLSGVAFGYALFVRPFPGILFIPVFGAAVLLQRELPLRKRIAAITAAAVPVMLAVGLLFLINNLLTGDAMKSGYHAAHAAAKRGAQGLGLFNFSKGIVASSVGSALIRQIFWLLGWPLSLCFVLFSKPKKAALLFYGFIVAVYAYRVVVPKTVVATLGPVYVTEVVPILILAVASGVVRLSSLAEEIGVDWGRRLIHTAVVSSFIVAWLCFIPVPIRDVGASAALRVSIIDNIRQQVKGDALVFAAHLIDPRLGVTWAAAPPNNSPSLDDSILWVLPKSGTEGAKENISFWKRHYPKRTAWLLWFKKGSPYLKRITAASDFTSPK